MNQAEASPKILVAPLDWGLGHATRCIPVIRELLLQNCEVVLAASGKGKALLQQEFPQLPMLHLPGYDIRYASSAWGLVIKIVAQIPKLLSAIKKEHVWLQKVVAQEGIHAVISDNRYGLYHPEIRSVFITHQLHIKTPLKWAAYFLANLNFRYINRYDECWIPDAEEENNLAGQLSHTPKKPAIPLCYLGPLSRFRNGQRQAAGEYLLVILSGPEPQRTLLEEMLLHDLKNYTGPVVFIRGLPGKAGTVAVAENITVHSHLSAAELEAVIGRASFVISRCGYSTVMDLAALQKKSILIPTPGQTEQEYLAKHLMKKQFALCIPQRKFNLKAALTLAEKFPYQLNQPAEEKLRAVISAFVNKLASIMSAAAEKSAKVV